MKALIFCAGAIIGGLSTGAALADEIVAAKVARAPMNCTSLYQQLDVNHDGKITRQALTPYAVMAKAFDEPQAQARGYLTEAEFLQACTHANTDSEGPG